jgi:hypothetical protein
MKTLYFVKFVTINPQAASPIVFLLTADNHSIVQCDAWELVADHCRMDYKLKEVTPICQTEDDIIPFEPC